jgi:hypothetical protein
LFQDGLGRFFALHGGFVAAGGQDHGTGQEDETEGVSGRSVQRRSPKFSRLPGKIFYPSFK